jgi:hypothetical protein
MCVQWEADSTSRRRSTTRGVLAGVAEMQSNESLKRRESEGFSLHSVGRFLEPHDFNLL